MYLQMINIGILFREHAGDAAAVLTHELLRNLATHSIRSGVAEKVVGAGKKVVGMYSGINPTSFGEDPICYLITYCCNYTRTKSDLLSVQQKQAIPFVPRLTVSDCHNFYRHRVLQPPARSYSSQCSL